MMMARKKVAMPKISAEIEHKMEELSVKYKHVR